MDNKNPIKDGSRRPRRRKPTNNPVKTEAGNPVMFVTIEEHNSALDEKISQLISLENGLRASESKLEQAEIKIKELREGNQKLRLSLSNESIAAAGYLNKLSKIPNWIKKLFNAA